MGRLTDYVDTRPRTRSLATGSFPKFAVLGPRLVVHPSAPWLPRRGNRPRRQSQSRTSVRRSSTDPISSDAGSMAREPNPKGSRPVQRSGSWADPFRWCATERVCQAVMGGGIHQSKSAVLVPGSRSGDGEGAGSLTLWPRTRQPSTHPRAGVFRALSIWRRAPSTFTAPKGVPAARALSGAGFCPAPEAAFASSTASGEKSGTGQRTGDCRSAEFDGGRR